MNHVMSFSLKQDFCFKFSRKVGVYSDEVTPVPIPNTEVKLINVNDTWLVTTWESKTMPAHNSIGSCFFQLPIFLLYRYLAEYWSIQLFLHFNKIMYYLKVSFG